MDSWQILKNMGMNAYVVFGWGEEWHTRWWPYPKDRVSKYAAPGVYVRPGFQEELVQAAGHHLKIIPMFGTDVMPYWTHNEYHGEPNALVALGKIMAAHANDPNIPAWYMVDEWDHEDPWWAKTKLYSHLLAVEARKSAPNRPVLMLAMGFMGVDTWKMMAEEADVLAVDIYPSDCGNNIEKALAKQAKYLTELRSVVGRKKPYILVPELFQMKGSGKKATAIVRTPAETIAQCYMGVIHGARGILLFQNCHPCNPAALAVHEDFMDGPAQVAHELFRGDAGGNNGVAKLLLPPSKAVNIMGEAKIVKWSNRSIHASLFEDAQGRRTLITLNATNKPVKGVRLEVANLPNGAVRTRFEAARPLPARHGGFSDDFDSLQRHVYDLPAGQR